MVLKLVGYLSNHRCPSILLDSGPACKDAGLDYLPIPIPTQATSNPVKHNKISQRLWLLSVVLSPHLSIRIWSLRLEGWRLVAYTI